MKQLIAAVATALFAVSAPAFADNHKKDEAKKAEAKKDEAKKDAAAKKDEKKKPKGGC